MDGIHDLGGKQGFLELEHDIEGPAFPDHWQGAVFTIVNTLLGQGVVPNVDYFRHAVERIDPVSYLSDGYYGRWLGAAETMLVETGVLAQADITARAVSLGASAADRVAARPSANFTDVYASHFTPKLRAATAVRESLQPAKFSLGQKVRSQHTCNSGHTRLPGYARNCVGEVVAQHGAWVYPDSNAHGLGEQPQHLYTVAFEASVLWGDGGEPGVEVCLDLFEPYLLEV